jgi:Na+-driven multidrug efflux pump
VVWMGLLDLGITSGLRVQAARLTGAAHREQLNRLASTGFFTQSAVVLLMVVLGTGLAVAFPHFFPVRADLRQDAMMVCLILVLSFALSTGTQTFSALLVAHQQMHIDNLIGLLLIAIRTVLTVVLLQMGWGLYSLAVAHVVAKVVTGVLAVWRTYRLLPLLQIRYRLASWESLRSIAGLGIWFTVGSLATIMTESLDSSVTAKVLSLEMVTSLSLTRRLYDLGGYVAVVLTETARPFLGQMLGDKQDGNAFRAYRHLTLITSSMAAVIGFSVWSGNQCFVQAWAGAINYAGKPVDLVMAFYIIAYNWIMPSQTLLAANLIVRPQCISRIIEGILNVGLAIVLGRRLGLVGIPLGALIATCLTSLWYLPRLTARMFNRPFAEFLRCEAFRVILLVSALFPIAWLSRGMADHINGYLGALAGAALTGTCGLLLVWLLVLDRSVKQQIPVRAWYERAVGAPWRALIGS